MLSFEFGFFRFGGFRGLGVEAVRAIGFKDLGASSLWLQGLG